MPVISIHNLEEFNSHISSAGSRLVVADFTATWCGPCQTIAPHFTVLSNKYAADGVFLKIDIDSCKDVAQHFKVTAVPTFIFFKNGEKLNVLRGADPVTLEAKITELINKGGASGEQVQGHGDLSVFFAKKDSECLNESDIHTFANLLEGKGYLESDCDEQLLISIGFSKPVKLHSLKVSGPDNAPKTLCLFINQPHTMDFDQAAGQHPVQMIELTQADVSKETFIELKYVKFQNVSNLQIFVKDNQAGSDLTRIDSLQLFGSAVNVTDMNEFKRVAGKKGEAH